MDSLTTSWDAHTTQLRMRIADESYLLRLCNPFNPVAIDSANFELIRQRLLQLHNVIFTEYLSEFLGLMQQVNPALNYNEIAQQIHNALLSSTIDSASISSEFMAQIPPILIESVYAKFYFPILARFISDVNICKIWLYVALNLNILTLYSRLNFLNCQAGIINPNFNLPYNVRSLHELLKKDFATNIAKFFDGYDFYASLNLPLLNSGYLDLPIIISNSTYPLTSATDAKLLDLCRAGEWDLVLALLLMKVTTLQKEFPPGKSPLESIAFNTHPTENYIQLLKFLAVHFANNYNCSFYSEYNYFYPFIGTIAATQPLTAIYEPLPSDPQEYHNFYKTLRKIQLHIILHNQFGLACGFLAVDNIVFKPTGSFGKFMAYEFLRYHKNVCNLLNNSIHEFDMSLAKQQQIYDVLNHYLWTSPLNKIVLAEHIRNRKIIAFEIQVMFDLYSHNLNALYVGDKLYIADRSKKNAAISIFRICDHERFLNDLMEIFGSRIEEHKFEKFMHSGSIFQKYEMDLPMQKSHNCTFTSMDALYHCITYEIAYENSGFKHAKKWCDFVVQYGAYQDFIELNSLRKFPFNVNFALDFLLRFQITYPQKTEIKFCELRKVILLCHYYLQFKAHSILGIHIDNSINSEDKMFVYDLGPKAVTHLYNPTISKDQRIGLNYGLSLDIVKQFWFTARHAFPLSLYPEHIEVIKSMKIYHLLSFDAGIPFEIIRQSWFQEHHTLFIKEYGIEYISDIDCLDINKFFAIMDENTEFVDYMEDILSCEYFSAEHILAANLFSLRIDLSQWLSEVNSSQFSNANQRLLKLYCSDLLSLLGPQALGLYYLSPEQVFIKEFKLIHAQAIHSGMSYEQVMSGSPEFINFAKENVQKIVITNPALTEQQNYYISAGLNESEACAANLSDAHFSAAREYGIYIRSIRDLTEQEVMQILAIGTKIPKWLINRIKNPNVETFDYDVVTHSNSAASGKEDVTICMEVIETHADLLPAPKLSM